MPWTLKFWAASPTPPAPVVTWNLTGAHASPGDVPLWQVTDITNAINTIAGLSPYATGRLNNFGQDIRIGYIANLSGGADVWAADKYIVLDVVAANKVFFFNSFGKLVQGNLGLTIMHELAHIYLPDDDEPARSATEIDMNGRNFDFWGGVIKEQNKIAEDAGLTDQIQTGYLAATESGTSFHSLFVENVSYTDNNVIDITRLGSASFDNMNHSQSTRNLRDLFFGLGGNDTLNAGRGNDYIYGGSGNDTITGGDGNDVVVGEANDDIFISGKGDDVAWGGTKGSTYYGTGDGTDLADYSAARDGIEISVDAATNRLTVQDGDGGTDQLASIERIIGSARSDTFTFTGSGTDAKVDMADVVDGYVLTTQNTYEVRVKGIETFVGGDTLTTFIGKAGTPAIFRAGSGGGDFTLTAGDRAYGHDGAVDTFRVTTTVPAEFSSYTEAQKVEYLRQNRVFLSNFDAEDQIYVNGVLFTGNTVTATVSAVASSDYNRDLPIAYVSLAGDSSYGTTYAQATFDEQGLSWGGQPWGSYLYSAGEIRDVTYHRTDQEGIGLITFSSRTITPDGSGFGAGYTLDPLASTDEMLVLAIEGFEDGYGGMSFVNDPLANLGRPTPFDDPGAAYTYTHLVSWSEPDQIWVGVENDLDGNDDGYMEPGGTPLDSDDEDFNFGVAPLGNSETDWEAYVLGADLRAGTENADTLDGGAGDDTLNGNDGDDVLIGGDGDDQLFGGAGEDQLFGNAGNDLLDGGSDIDEMVGGAGDDTYVVDDEYDIVTEDADAGSDTILTSMTSFTLAAANVENLGYVGFANFTGTGDAGDNLLWGDYGDDVLSGGDGNDSFRTSEGSDQFDGGDGTDTIRVAARWAVELSESLGVITVVDYTIGNSTSELTSVERIYFADIDESFTFAEVFEPSFTGTSGNDDPLEGNNLGNEISGLDGDDVLIGAGGNDTLDGGDGIDTAWFEGASTEYLAYLDSDGTAWVEALVTDEGGDWLVDMEAIYFAGDNVTLLLSELPPVGTSGNDSLAGSSRPDLLMGLEGNDSLAGLAGDDTLNGNEGDDLYLFGTGNDYAYDPAGDDIYVYELGDGDDVLSDQVGTDAIEFGSGIDPLDVTVTANWDGGYILSIASGGSVWIQYGTEPSNTIEEVRFADTTVWTDEDLYDMAYGSALRSGGGETEGIWQRPELSVAEVRLSLVSEMNVYIA